MHLLIRAVSLAGQPLTQAISAYFDERGGTIGRSDTNTLALPDPERRISRLQAELSRTPDGWRILNVGNANPIWHNNRPVPPGEGVLLDQGDELQIGTYALQVTYSQNDATARTITKGRAAVDSRTVIVGSGAEPKTGPGMMLSELAAGSGVTPVSAAPASPPVAPPVAPPAASPAATSSSPFADLLGGWAAPTPAPSPAPSASPFAFTGAPAASPSPSPFVAAPAAQSPFAATPAPAPSTSSPFADLLGFGASPSASAPGAASTGGNAARLPDDFDPFADFQPAAPASGRPAAPAGSWDLPKSAPAPASASPFDLSPGASPLPGDLDLMGSVAPPGSQSLDQMFGLGGGAASHDPLADFLKKTESEVPAEPPSGSPSHLDPLALFSSREEVAEAAAAKPVQHGPAFPDDVPELQAAMPLPTVPARPSVPLDAAREAAKQARELEPPTLVGRSLDAPPKAKPSEPMSASFTFMAPPSAAPATPEPAKVEPAAPDTASPFADLGLGEPARVSLLDDLDLAPKPAQGGFAPAASCIEAAAVAPSHAAPEQGAVPVAMGADQQALWAAFCEGAGVRFVPPQGLNPDLMRVIGQLLHHTIDGSLKLVAARAATKVEMRAEVTVIQARRNNPLKFSPDTQSAMEQLLQPPMRGFMSGPEAVADAMDDLLGHTIGTMVGMRAALDGVLARFKPEQLEAKLVGHSMLDSVLPMNRRAKLWELYLQHYESVRNEAQDDFHNLFGRAFLQAYEEQLDRLANERRASGRAHGGKA